MGIPEALLIVGIASLAASLATTGIGIAQASEQASAKRKVAKFNAQVSENNAIAASQAAAYEARQIRRKNIIRLGSQRAIAAKSGVDITAGGSIDDVIFDSSVQGELEAKSAEYAGQLRAASYRSGAALSLFEGRQAASALGLNIAATSLRGAGDAFSAGSDIIAGQARFKSLKAPAGAK